MSPLDDAGARDYHASGPRGATRARARQAAKRRTFPLINSHIIWAADTGDLEVFVSTIEAYLPQMNLVNLSTALHRLAKIAATPEARSSPRVRSALPALAAAVREALLRAEAGRAPPQCQALSNVVWSLAVVGFADDLSLLRLASERALEHLEHFKPFELASILWAFATLGGCDDTVWDFSTPLLRKAAGHVAAQPEQFTFRCLVMIAWAFATVKDVLRPDPDVMRCLALRILPSLPTATCHELTQVAWAFSTVGIRDEAFFAQIAQRAVQRVLELKRHDLADMLWSCANAGYFHRGLFESAAIAAQAVDLELPQVIVVLWSFSHLRPRHHATRVAMLSLLPRCTPMLDALRQEDLSAVLLGAAKCFGRLGAPSGASAASVPPVPEQAIEFFDAVAERTRARPGQLGDLPLAHAAISFLAVRGIAGQRGLAATLQEALDRRVSLEAQALWLLLRALSAEPGCPLAEDVKRGLFEEAARRAEMLPPGEQEALSQLCWELLGPEAEGDLRAQCLTLAAGAAHQGATVDICAISVGAAWPPKPEGEARREARPEARAGPGSPASSRAGSAGKVSKASEGTTAGGGSDVGATAEKTWVTEVKNTFITIPRQVSEEVLVPDLPPPLDIIRPEVVSAERLAEYRVDYQRFRAGSALGARGEL